MCGSLAVFSSVRFCVGSPRAMLLGQCACSDKITGNMYQACVTEAGVARSGDRDVQQCRIRLEDRPFFVSLQQPESADATPTAAPFVRVAPIMIPTGATTTTAAAAVVSATGRAHARAMATVSGDMTATLGGCHAWGALHTWLAMSIPHAQPPPVCWLPPRSRTPVARLRRS